MHYRSRGWNLRRKLVTLECPGCKRTKQVQSEDTDPPNTAKVVFMCDRCPEDAAIIDYFDAEGRQINLDGRPLHT